MPLLSLLSLWDTRLRRTLRAAILAVDPGEDDDPGEDHDAPTPVSMTPSAVPWNERRT